MKKRVLSVLLAVLLCIAVASCGASPRAEIERLNQRFCRSYNHCDLEGVLDCLEPGLAESVRLMVDMSIGLFGALSDVDMELDSGQLFALLSLCFQDMPAEELLDLGMPTLEIELYSLELNGEQDYARAEGVLRLTVDGQTEETTGQLYYVRIDGEWYLALSNFA